MKVYEYEPLLPDSVITHSGTKPLPKPYRKMDAVITSVAHAQSRNWGITEMCRCMHSHPVRIDRRGRANQGAAEGTGMYYRKAGNYE